MTTINIIGTVGAGKTTLARKLQDATGLPVGYESNSEELSRDTRKLLSRYYADPAAHALEKNLFFLDQRAKTLAANQTKEAYISDRFLYDDFLMAVLNRHNNQLTNDEWQQYLAAFHEVENTYYPKDQPSNDILIFIMPGFDHALKQIEQRGRVEEQISIHPELRAYYRDMYKLYLETYTNWHTTPKLIVEHVDEVDTNSLLDEIKTKQPSFNDIFAWL